MTRHSVKSAGRGGGAKSRRAVTGLQRSRAGLASRRTGARRAGASLRYGISGTALTPCMSEFNRNGAQISMLFRVGGWYCHSKTEDRVSRHVRTCPTLATLRFIILALAVLTGSLNCCLRTPPRLVYAHDT